MSSVNLPAWVVSLASGTVRLSRHASQAPSDAMNAHRQGREAGLANTLGVGRVNRGCCSVQRWLPTKRAGPLGLCSGHTSGGKARIYAQLHCSRLMTQWWCCLGTPSDALACIARCEPALRHQQAPTLLAAAALTQATVAMLPCVPSPWLKRQTKMAASMATSAPGAAVSTKTSLAPGTVLGLRPA